MAGKGPDVVEESDVVLLSVPIAQIVAGRNPRSGTDEARQRDLTESIKLHGVLQPLLLRQTGEVYEVVAGHRRWQAAQDAHLASVPALISTQEGVEAFVQALVENIQREELDPLDEAAAFKALLAETNWTQEELGRRVGRQQPQIAHSLALLTMHPDVQQQLRDRSLTAGHAKVLARMPEPDQRALAKRAVDERLTVRDVEAAAADLRERRREAKEEAVKAQAAAVDIADWLNKGKGISTSTVVLMNEPGTTKLLREQGWTVRAPDYQTDTINPPYECDCDAVFTTIDANGLRPACVSKAHERRHLKAVAATRKKAEKDADARLRKGRTTIAKEIIAKDEATLTDEGLRGALYAILIKGEGYDQNARRNFVLRNGGEWPKDYPDQLSGDAIWEAIEGLSPQDLVREIADHIAQAVMPNVFLNSPYANRQHVLARQFFVKRLKLDDSLVWGDQEPWPDHYVPQEGADENGVDKPNGD